MHNRFSLQYIFWRHLPWSDTTSEHHQPAVCPLVLLFDQEAANVKNYPWRYTVLTGRWREAQEDVKCKSQFRISLLFNTNTTTRWNQPACPRLRMEKLISTKSNFSDCTLRKLVVLLVYYLLAYINILLCQSWNNNNLCKCCISTIFMGLF